MSPLPSESVEPVDIELSTAAWSLADAFEGVVSNEDDRPVPRPRSVHPISEPDVSGMRESSSIKPPDDSPQTVQLDLFRDGGAVEPQSISLHQLRHWYAIAQALDRSTQQLARIQALGLRFKQTFGEAHADLEHLWTGWNDSDYNQWQWDLVVHDYRTHSPEAVPRQLSFHPF